MTALRGGLTARTARRSPGEVRRLAVLGFGKLGRACSEAILASEDLHQMLLLEARFDRPSLAAQVMLAAARALPDQPPGGHALSEVPLSRLFACQRS